MKWRKLPLAEGVLRHSRLVAGYGAGTLAFIYLIDSQAVAKCLVLDKYLKINKLYL